MDIISAIDQATGCQQCGKPLGNSPSGDFCGEGCQQCWYANRVNVPLVSAAVGPAMSSAAFRSRVAELATQLDYESWTLSNPPQFHSGDRMTVQGLTGPAEVHTYDGQGWFSVGHVSGPVSVTVDEPSPWRRGSSSENATTWAEWSERERTAFPDPAPYLAALERSAQAMADQCGIPRELLGNYEPGDVTDPPNAVHVRGDGTSYIPGAEDS